MRKWGTIVSLFYALIVVGLLVPAGVVLAGAGIPFSRTFRDAVLGAYGTAVLWAPIAVLIVGQVMLLFLSVDTSHKRLKPRTHVLISCAVSALLVGLLTFAVVFAVGVAIYNENFGGKYLNTTMQVAGFLAILWIFWGTVFFLYFRNASEVTTRAISWLLKGSVLELLVVVPCHVVVRRRGDCSAPIVTGFGIATGIAVMLLSFGPSVLLLYKKRLDSYSARNPK